MHTIFSILAAIALTVTAASAQDDTPRNNLADTELTNLLTAQQRLMREHDSVEKRCEVMSSIAIMRYQTLSTTSGNGPIKIYKKIEVVPSELEHIVEATAQQLVRAEEMCDRADQLQAEIFQLNNDIRQLR